MFNNLKFHWLYLLNLIIWPLQVAGFITTIFFFTAKPISTLDLHGKSLPATWEAAVENHKSFIEWYLIGSHPIAFTACLFLLLSSSAALYRVDKALSQLEANGEIKTTTHKIVQLIHFAALAAFIWFVVMKLLVGVDPS